MCGQRAATVRSEAARLGAGGGGRLARLVRPRPPPPTSLWQRCSPSPASANIVVAAMFAGEPRCHNDVAELASRRTSLWQRCSRWPARRRRATVGRVADRRADRGPISSLGDGAGVGAQVHAGRVRGRRGGRVLDCLTGAVMARGTGEAGSLPAARVRFLLAAGAEADAAGHGLTHPCARAGLCRYLIGFGATGAGAAGRAVGARLGFSMTRRAAWLSEVSFRIWRKPLFAVNPP